LVDQFGGVAHQAYFGLYDGHDTRETVDFVVKALHTNLLTIVKKQPTMSWGVAFEKAYLLTDAQVRRRVCIATTALSCHMSYAIAC
jgi:hypothetical protein